MTHYKSDNSLQIRNLIFLGLHSFLILFTEPQPLIPLFLLLILLLLFHSLLSCLLDCLSPPQELMTMQFLHSY